ncbi:MAG: CHRD domain-containing protein [Ilumatobacteraceae bacterium]
MHKRTLAAMTAVGLAAAIAIPTIAFGNARANRGTLNFLQAANTPYVAQLSGANESPLGDPDGAGGAAVTFDIIQGSTTTAEVCWDLSYSGLTGTPITAHIHRGAAGVNGAILIPFLPFTDLGPNSASGCAAVDPALATEIMTTPANFYVNVHTSDFTGGAIRGQLSKGAPPAGEAHLLPVPLRAYDSRDNGGAKLAALETRTVSLATGKDNLNASVLAVPPGATAAIVTLTVTETVGPGGFLKLYSAALAAAPATSSINWAGNNQNIAVTTQVAVDAAGQVKVQGGANSTHFVIDVVGYLF